MYLLDTDTLTHLHAGNERVVARLRSIGDPNVGTTNVSKIEILRARYDFLLKAATGEELLRSQSWLRRSEELLSGILLIMVDERAANEFERLRQLKKLKKIDRADLLIASIALANRATLITRNLRHFRQISDLKLEN